MDKTYNISKAVSQSVGTTVVANPTLDGSESELTSLQVGDTKYKVPSGGGGSGTQLYKHDITINNSYKFTVFIDNNTQITNEQELCMISAHNVISSITSKFGDFDPCYKFEGIKLDNRANLMSLLLSYVEFVDTDYKLEYISLDEINSITDSVTPL